MPTLPSLLPYPASIILMIVRGYHSGDTHTGALANSLDYASPDDATRDRLIAENKVPPGVKVGLDHGDPVLAVRDGVVQTVDRDVPEGTQDASFSRDPTIDTSLGDSRLGNYALVKSDGSAFVLNAHLGQVLVDNMQAIDAGDQLGTVGKTGLRTGLHIHDTTGSTTTQWQQGEVADSSGDTQPALRPLELNDVGTSEGTLAQGDLLTVGETAYGTIAGVGQTEIFAAQLNVGRQYAVTVLQADWAGIGTELRNPAISAFEMLSTDEIASTNDADGLRELGRNDDMDATSLNSRLVITPTENLTAVLEVSSSSADPDGTGGFGLLVEDIGPALGDWPFSA